MDERNARGDGQRRRLWETVGSVIWFAFGAFMIVAGVFLLVVIVVD